MFLRRCAIILGLQPTDVTDWQFVEVRDVPPGPWRNYGDNNHSSSRSAQAQRTPRRNSTDATNKAKK